MQQKCKGAFIYQTGESQNERSEGSFSSILKATDWNFPDLPERDWFHLKNVGDSRTSASKVCWARMTQNLGLITPMRMASDGSE